MKPGRLLMFLTIVLLGLGSCSPAPRDIRVRLEGSSLIVDFPWSFWRLVGLADRSWCVSEIQVFDKERIIWGAQRTSGDSCTEVRMPIVIGKAPPGFVSEGTARFRLGVQYGVGISAPAQG